MPNAKDACNFNTCISFQLFSNDILIFGFFTFIFISRLLLASLLPEFSLSVLFLFHVHNYIETVVNFEDFIREIYLERLK